MNIYLDKIIGENYNNYSQKARVITEKWTKENIFCPRCGNISITQSKNNTPVSDFYCPKCNNIYELKSKKGNIGTKIVDGAYTTMVQRITSNTNPDFFLMSYAITDFKIQDFIFIPKHFFIPEIIEKRNPLSETAHRAGWVGCNILLKSIPEDGRIYIIQNSIKIDRNIVLNKVNKTAFLKDIDINGRGWLIDILKCINTIQTKEFSLAEIYNFEKELSIKYPANKHIKDKIRQQLQILRDKKYINFLGNGKYSKGDINEKIQS